MSCASGLIWVSPMLAKHQQGFTLLETAIVVTLTGWVMWTLAIIFQVQLSTSRHLSDKLLLKQQLHGVIDILQRDSRLAGFNAIEGESVGFSDHQSLQTDNRTHHQLAYVYREAGKKEIYRHVVYRQDHERLLVCEKLSARRLTLAEASTSTPQGLCYSLFDPDTIRVNAFNVHHDSLNSRNTRSGFISVSIQVSLIHDRAVSERMATQFVQRNWLE